MEESIVIATGYRHDGQRNLTGVVAHYDRLVGVLRKVRRYLIHFLPDLLDHVGGLGLVTDGDLEERESGDRGRLDDLDIVELGDRVLDRPRHQVLDRLRIGPHEGGDDPAVEGVELRIFAPRQGHERPGAGDQQRRDDQNADPVIPQNAGDQRRRPW